MDDAERFRLLGKYRTPRFCIGRTVFCEVRGEMVITGVTEAQIPWPVGRRGRERPSLVVYKDLAKAIRREGRVCRQPRRIKILLRRGRSPRGLRLYW
jgi:hypothetical protein